MKVLLVANYKGIIGGISGAVYNIVNKLKEEDITAEIFNTNVSFIKRLLIIFPLIRKAKQFDIVHIHGCSNLGFFPILVGVFVSKIVVKKKAIITYHGGGAELFLKRHHLLVKRIMDKVDHVTVMSGFLQNVFSRFNIKTTILPNIIDVEVKDCQSVDFSSVRLISIRSLSKLYNIDDIIKAFEITKRTFKDAELTIVGNGPMSKKLKKHCEEYGLSRVKFIGKIPNDQIPSFLCESNILISVPSLDNQPLSVLEGFAAGIPVISSKVGGILDMINDGENGFLVDVHSPDQIADKIKWIIDNPDKTRKIVENARTKLDQYRWESVREKLLNIYKN